jgi:hypothetical protein
MSALTPAARGGLGNQRLNTALMAIALAVVLLAALVGLRALVGRTTTAAPAPAPAPASQFEHGWASTDAGSVVVASSLGGNLVSPESLYEHGWLSAGSSTLETPEMIFEHGWASTDNATLGQSFAVAGDHAAATDGGSTAISSRPGEPGHHGVTFESRHGQPLAPIRIGRGTNLAR